MNEIVTNLQRVVLILELRMMLNYLKMIYKYADLINVNIIMALENLTVLHTIHFQ